MYGEVISLIATPEMAGEKKPNNKTKHKSFCSCKLLVNLNGAERIRDVFGWTVADGSCPCTPWPLGQGVAGSASPLERLPTTALLLLLKSYCNTAPR